MRVTVVQQSDESTAGGLKFREASFAQGLSAASVKGAGDWLRLRVDSVNGTARVFLNDALISVSDQFERRTGHMGLEVMRGAIEVRSPALSGSINSTPHQRHVREARRSEGT